MAMFDQLNTIDQINQIQAELAALRKAFEAVESTYQWSTAYSLSDFENPPFSLSAAAGQDILNALADAHDLWMTAQGVVGWPTATLPYNFFASMRAITGSR